MVNEPLADAPMSGRGCASAASADARHALAGAIGQLLPAMNEHLALGRNASSRSSRSTSPRPSMPAWRCSRSCTS